MADSHVPVTGGSGYNVDTRTESTNAHHRQVVVIGDPDTNGGVAPVDASTGLKVNVSNTSLTVADGGSTISVDDGGGALTVDGTVAATQSGTWNVTNVSGTVSLPTGASTLAEQQTQTTHLSQIETAVELIDDAVYTDGSGTPSKGIGIAGTDGTNPQLVSVTSAGAVNIADGGNTITVDGTVAATQSGTWNVTDISGTVSLPTGAATSAKQDTQITALQLLDDVVATDGQGALTKGYQIAGTDGTNAQVVSVTSAGAVNIADGGNTITVDGTVAATQSGSWTVTANAGTGNFANNLAQYSGSAVGAGNAIHVQPGTSAVFNVADNGGTLTVDGTVTANAGTGFPPVVTNGSAASSSAIHMAGTDGTNARVVSTNSSGHVNIADGGNSLTVDNGGTFAVQVSSALPTGTNTIGNVKLTDGTNTATVRDLTSGDALAVAIVDGSGDQITTFGGGAQYTEGDTDATITGTAVMFETNTGTSALGVVSATNPLPISDAGGAITVDGSVSLGAAIPAGTNNIGDVDVASLPSGSIAAASVVTKDYDTGAGTETMPVFGIALPASGGSVAGGTTTNPIQVADAGGSLTVDGTVSVTGVSTAANQTTIIGHLDGVEGLLTTIDADTGNIATDVDTVASTVATIGTTPLVRMAIYDASDTQITSFGGGTQYTEDAAAAADPVGNMFITRRKDTLSASEVSADGDNIAVNATSKGEVYVKHVDAIPVTDNDGTLTVDGTVGVSGTVAVTQSGTWDEVGINDSGNSITVDDGASSLTVDNAGTFAVQVDGAALTALQLIDNPVLVDDAAFTPGTSSVMMAGFEYDDTTPDSVNEGDGGAARMSANRNIYVQVRDAAGNERGMNVDASGNIGVTDAGGSLTVDGTVGVSGTVAVTQSGTWDEVGINDSGNSITVDAPVGTPVFVRLSDGSSAIATLPVSLASVPSHAVTNAGTFAVQVDGSALTALQLIDDPVIADDAAFTPGTTKVNMAGFEADETSTDSVDEGDAGAARMTLDRKQIVTPQPHTTGGLTPFRSLDLDETEEEVKASAGQVYGLIFTNTATSTRWLKFYNATAANVTVGTTTPVMTIGLPGNSSDDISGLFNSGGMGIAFDTAITVAATTGLADNDTGAPGANEVIVNIFYK